MRQTHRTCSACLAGNCGGVGQTQDARRTRHLGRIALRTQFSPFPKVFGTVLCWQKPNTECVGVQLNVSSVSNVNQWLSMSLTSVSNFDGKLRLVLHIHTIRLGFWLRIYYQKQTLLTSTPGPSVYNALICPTQFSRECHSL